MATPNDIRESFPTTETLAGVGVPLTSVVPGQATANTNGQIGFAFQDANGNAILPQLDSQGRIPVSNEGQGTRLRAHGDVSGALLSATGSVYSNLQTVLTVPITNSVTGRSINDMQGNVACRRDALFQMVYADSSSSVVLDTIIVGPGQYSSRIGIGPDDEFLVPASATSPVFKILAGNFSTVSDLHSTLSVLQF